MCYAAVRTLHTAHCYVSEPLGRRVCATGFLNCLLEFCDHRQILLRGLLVATTIFHRILEHFLETIEESRGSHTSPQWHTQVAMGGVQGADGQLLRVCATI